jgi:phage tail-like protein
MTDIPYQTFNFHISLALRGEENRAPMCRADFWECDGLEMTLEPKTIREGGNNARPIHLVGPVSYGQLTLRRGMTTDFGLWDWFERVVRDGEHNLRADGLIEILDTQRGAAEPDETGGLPPVRTAFRLTGCLPVKLKAPGLNAKDGGIAVEEMQLVYETMRREKED